jgi:hypothetical protein
MGGWNLNVVRLLERFFDCFARIFKRVAKKGRPILSAYRFLLHRMHSIPLSPSRKQKEWNIIQQIAYHTFYD